MSGKISDIPPDDGDPAGGSDLSLDALCPGARFATYELEELIGVGSTACIYRARDGRLLREVAIKIWTSGAPAGEDGLARFLHEARTAAVIRHPNVVDVFDVGVHDGAPYIVMELLAGEDLEARLRSGRTLAEPALIELALPLVAALAAVHEAGVVHRDLKPSNIFLSGRPNGDVQPTLLDFGVSKHARDTLRLTTLGRQRWAAMPLYTAPEVLLGGEATALSDQYSLGVLLYEAVTGSNPFRSENARESIELITSGQYLPASAHAHRASRGFAKIIERAMSPEPAERYGDLRELGRALVALAGRRARATWGGIFGAELVAAAAPPPSPRRNASPTVRRELATWALGAAVVGWSVAGVLSAWFLTARPRVVSTLGTTTVAPALAPPPRHVDSEAPSSIAAARHAAEADRPATSEPVALAHHQVEAGPHHDGVLLVPAPPVPLGHIEEPASVASLPAIEPGVVPPGEPAPVGDPAALPADPAALPGAPGLAPPIDPALQPGGAPDGSLGVPPGAASPAPNTANPERGTNGALIFD